MTTTTVRGGPTVDVYGGPVRDFPETIGGLPVTGLDLMLVAAAAMAAIALGLLLRWRSGRKAAADG